MSRDPLPFYCLATFLAATSLPLQAQELAAPGALGADILPKGRSAVRMETRYSQADEEFSDQGDRQSLLSDYNGLNLNATIFPALGFFGPGASLGTTDLSARMTGKQTRMTFGYGLTDDLTVGFQVGYGEARSKVRASVVGGNIPPGLVFPGATTPTEAVQGLLTTLYGYKPIQSSTWHSALDPLLGLRWRFDKGENHATVFAPTLRFGVAKQPDPNDLMQMVLGDGTDDILLGVMHTRKLASQWDLLLSAQYTVQLADHVTARARGASELLVPASRLEKLERDRTNPLELTAELGYSSGPWRFSGRLEYARGGEDHYSSPTGQDVSGLEIGSDFHFLLGYLGVSWNGIPGYLRGEHRFPVIVSLVAATTLEAKNTSAPDTVYLTLTMPF
jgi:hypothetical protein